MWLLAEQGKNSRVKDFFHTVVTPFTLRLTTNAEPPGCAGQAGNFQPRLREHFPLDIKAHTTTKTAQETAAQCCAEHGVYLHGFK